MTKLLALSLLLFIGLARISQAASPELTASVKSLLSAYEPLDLDRTLPALASPAAISEVLLTLAREPGTDGPTAPLVRVRAIEALGYVPTADGLAYLRGRVAELSDAEDSRVYQLAACLRALGHFGDAELGRIAPYLGHPSADVREAAALAMRSMPASRPLLQRRLAIEPERGVQATLAQSLSALKPLPATRPTRAIPRP